MSPTFGSQVAAAEAAGLCTEVGAEAAVMPDVSRFHRSSDAEQDEVPPPLDAPLGVPVRGRPLVFPANAGRLIKVR